MSRRALLPLLVALGALAVVALPAAAGPPGAGPSIHVVHQDPRLCPSPLCGGYWVQLANHSRTRCFDGALRARCYVARAVDVDRHPLEQAVPDGALARAEIEPWRFEGLGELGVLVVAKAFAPVGEGAASGRYFRVVDRGIRCVRAPCFSLRASLLNTSRHALLSGLVAAGTISESLVARVERALAKRDVVFARGRTHGTVDGGRELVVTRFFFGSEG